LHTDWYFENIQLLWWWLQGKGIADLGTDTLGNAEMGTLVSDIVLHLKTVVPLCCKWNKHKNNHKDHGLFV